MTDGFCFVSYSRVDGEEFALKLADQLAAGPPSIGVWLDRRRLHPSGDIGLHSVDGRERRPTAHY